MVEAQLPIAVAGLFLFSDKQTYFYRRVRRWLKRRHGKNVNLNAVLRVMRKLDLLSQVHRRKPYRH